MALNFPLGDCTELEQYIHSAIKRYLCWNKQQQIKIIIIKILNIQENKETTTTIMDCFFFKNPSRKDFNGHKLISL